MTRKWVASLLAAAKAGYVWNKGSLQNSSVVAKYTVEVLNKRKKGSQNWEVKWSMPMVRRYEEKYHWKTKRFKESGHNEW